MGTSVAFRRLCEAIRNSRPHAHGALVDYFNLLSHNLSKFRLEPSNGATDFDQKVVESIEQFIPNRNELIEVFAAIAQYDKASDSAPVIHKFFESLIPYLDRPEGVTRYHEWDWDNLKFIIQESFIICISVFLKYERFDIVERLLKQQYYIEDDKNGRSRMRSFGIFRSNLESLKQRSNKLKLNRLSLHADILKERCTDSGISFNQIMQADFLLYLVGALQGLKEKRRQEWHPDTLLFKTFHGGTFEMFLRGESTEYFNRFAPVLGVKAKSDLEKFCEALRNETVYIPKWQFEDISPLELMNFDNLCSRA